MWPIKSIKTSNKPKVKKMARISISYMKRLRGRSRDSQDSGIEVAWYLVAQLQQPNRFTTSSSSNSRPKALCKVNTTRKSQEHSKLRRKFQTVADQIRLQALPRTTTIGRRRFKVNQMAKAMGRYWLEERYWAQGKARYQPVSWWQPIKSPHPRLMVR